VTDSEILGFSPKTGAARAKAAVENICRFVAPEILQKSALPAALRAIRKFNPKSEITERRLRAHLHGEARRVTFDEILELEEVAETLWILTHGMSGEEKRLWASAMEAGVLAQYRREGWKARKQNRKRCRVHKYILSGAEVIEDCGYIPKDLPGWIVLDMDATAENVKADYTAVDFDGVTYWVR
jgi:hypothetical protein